MGLSAEKDWHALIIVKRCLQEKAILKFSLISL